jgi:histidyl-tRNA synthetase
VYQIPRGTRDFTPEEMQKRRYVENSIKSTFQKFGYKEIQTPMFENLELFTAKSGDTIIDELYSFKDKAGREIALRPELTAPVIRFYVDKLQMEPKPIKLFYFGNCFRYDRPQKGRYREFRQAGCEIIGTSNPEAYAELIALAYTILKNVGLKDIKLYIGNLNILSSIFKTLNLSKDKQKQLIPLIDKSQFDEISSLMRDFDISQDKIENFLEILQTSNIEKISKYISNDETASNKLSYLEELLNLLEKSFNIKDYQIKIGIVRGLDYYKGVVFEIDAPVLGAEKQLCGGGAYELISLFGGRETPTAGFAIGFDRTILALETENYKFPSENIHVFIIPVTSETIEKSIEIAQILRHDGKTTDIDLSRRGMSKALKYASSINAEKIVIIGPDELAQDSVSIRDMNSGEQKLVKINEILKAI